MLTNVLLDTHHGVTRYDRATKYAATWGNFGSNRSTTLRACAQVDWASGCWKIVWNIA